MKRIDDHYGGVRQTDRGGDRVDTVDFGPLEKLIDRPNIATFHDQNTSLPMSD